MTDAKAESARDDAPLPKADPSMFDPCPQPVVSNKTEEAHAMAEGVRMRENPAEWAFVRLSKMIQEFESNLDKNDEVGARIVGLPGDGTMQVEDVGFWGPDFIMFFGRNSNGKPVRLIQHYTQISVVLNAMPKPEEREARRIGFQLSELVDKTNPK